MAESRGVGDSAQIESAAWYVLGPGLQREPSPLDPAVISWTASAAGEMLRRVQDEPDFGKASFLAKLQLQLAGRRATWCCWRLSCSTCRLFP